MRDIYVIAHTEAQHHVDGLVGGWFDSELTELGRRQAAAVADRVADLVGRRRPVEIFASDLLRATQTAQPIAERLGTPVIHEPGLRELNYGVAGGRPVSWLESRMSVPGKNGDRLDHGNGIEGAETKRQFLTRVYRAMDRITKSSCTTQVVMTHGYVLTFLIAAWIRMPLESAGWVNFSTNGGGITHLHEDDERFNRHVLSLNDRAHLAGVAT